MILELRITDVSPVTRENALEIIHKNLNHLVRISDSNPKFQITKYIDMVIERAENDTNLSVRKKVIQILSMILDQDFSKKCEFDELKQRIIKILISKWSDTTTSLGQIRSSLVNSIQKILKSTKNSG